jgi:hypothetical protein
MVLLLVKTLRPNWDYSFLIQSPNLTRLNTTAEWDRCAQLFFCLIVGNTIVRTEATEYVARVSQADISTIILMVTTEMESCDSEFWCEFGNDTGKPLSTCRHHHRRERTVGLKGTIGEADGLLGTLTGSMGRVFFDLRSINSTKTWSCRL